MSPKRFVAFSERNFWLLLFSRTTASIADWLLLFVLLGVSEQQTNSAFLSHGLFGFKLFSTFVALIFAGAYADKFNRRALLVTSDLLRAIIALSMMLFLGTSTGALFLATFIFTLVGSLYAAASMAIIPQTIKPENLLSANLFFSVLLMGTFAVGQPLAGYMLEHLTTGTCLVVIGAMFVASGVVVPLIHEYRQVKKSTKRKIWQDIREGFGYCFTSPKLKGFLAATVPIAFGVGPLLLLLTHLISQELNLGTSSTGKVYPFFGAGVLVGFFFLHFFGNRVGAGKLVSSGLLLSGGAVIYISTASSFWLVAIPAVIAGCGVVIAYTAITTTMHLIVPDAIMGRVIMTLVGLGAMVGAVSNFTIGYLVGPLGIRTALSISGGSIVLGAVLFYKLSRLSIRDSKTHRLIKLKGNS